MFDTKVALIVRNDLAVWQRLNVVAFLASGIAAAAPEVMGEPYVDAKGRRYGNMLGQPMMVFEGDVTELQAAHRKAARHPEQQVLLQAQARSRCRLGRTETASRLAPRPSRQIAA